MSVGFTSIGVTVVEIRRFEVQGPIGEIFSANRPLEEKLNAPFSGNTLSIEESALEPEEE